MCFVRALCFAMLLSAANGISCGTPKLIDFATYEYTGRQLPNGRYKEGSEVTYTCIEGYDKARATCLRGKWTGNVTNIRCCKEHTCNECGPPPTIENGIATKTSGTGNGNSVGTQYTYVCDVGYGLTSNANQIRCTSDLTWESISEYGTEPEDRSIKCTITDYADVSHETDNEPYDNSSYRRRRRKPPTTLETIIGVAIISAAVIYITVKYLLNRHRRQSRNRAVTLNGVTTTEYVGPVGSNNYSGPPPTLTTGPAIFSPFPSPQAAQGGMYPSETYPLASQSRFTNNGCYSNYGLNTGPLGPSPPFQGTAIETSK